MATCAVRSQVPSGTGSVTTPARYAVSVPSAGPLAAAVAVVHGDGDAAVDRPSSPAQASSRVRPISTRCPARQRASAAPPQSARVRRRAHPSSPAPVAGSTSRWRSTPSASTSAMSQGTTSSHSWARTSAAVRGRASPGAGARRARRPTRPCRAATAAAHHVDAGELQRRVGGREVGEQLSAPCADVDDVREAPVAGQLDDGAREGLAQHAVGGRGEVARWPASTPVEPLRSVERLLPRVPPRDPSHRHTVTARSPRRECRCRRPSAAR